MRYLYFTKLLQGLDLAGMATFIHSAGLDGVDLAVRPGYPVDPTNVEQQLPEAVRICKDHGLVLPLVSIPTNLTDPAAADLKRIFHACAASGVGFVKIGYFPVEHDFEAAFRRARQQLEGLAALAAKTGVKVCYHTHSGSNLGSNCEGQRTLLEPFDPHHVGSYVDTGHQAIGGAPFRLALAMIARWFTLLAIKDMRWQKTANGWKRDVVPIGGGLVDWQDVSQALKDRRYDGLISLHAEYETASLDERLAKAKEELAFLRQTLG